MLNKLKRAALGAHTPHDKATAASKPVPMPLPAQVRILMSQHIGAPAKALVKKGDEVFVGTKIGEAGGFVSANIHSSVSGTVAAVEPFRLSNGRMCDSVVIKTDGKQTVDPAVKAPEVTDKASFLAAVRACGLVGLGGAGFPTDVKLQPKPPVDTLLINASECEVWLTSDTQEMLNCSDDIIRGIEAVLKYVGIPKCVIGIENNKPECIDLLCQKTKDKPAIEVKPLPSVYGTGAELILIEKCLGREVPHGGLPADAGAIVMNVTSVSTLGKYLATGMPVVSRCITVDGDACAKPQNLIVPVGTAYEDVLNAAGVKGGVKLARWSPAVHDGPRCREPELPHHQDHFRPHHAERHRCTACTGLSLHPLRPLRRVLPDGSGAGGSQSGLRRPRCSGAGQAACGLLLQLRLLLVRLPGKASLHPDDGSGKGVLPW